jgi:urease accessory protein UreE
MRTKALVIGALASEHFVGPWVDISEAHEWDVIVEGDYGRQVVLAVDHNSPILLDGDAIRISGKEARVIVQAPILDVKTVTVRLEQVV